MLADWLHTGSGEKGQHVTINLNIWRPLHIRGFSSCWYPLPPVISLLSAHGRRSLNACNHDIPSISTLNQHRLFWHFVRAKVLHNAIERKALRIGKTGFGISVMAWHHVALSVDRLALYPPNLHSPKRLKSSPHETNPEKHTHGACFSVSGSCLCLAR
ncbi:hypothetical protein M441DRAFT_335732 [Trichoderma asperellum CBS 433.97]|uniref:Uncharacterized protein n=1 Tax=Trichoderma asperellum (strain ATCC 204424 / CBS 433.97 / NBRC 101777) TaxID=1042311 RepID=A0A2T3ZG75_TRIA4|nr:hypothetical protein M441DRAFT_335732 [Trichoderma asperellum CBS 433.97]PTB43783.1 hypothetical protein M441DRAFT_335732 [Trichoderma asperellum CBS 433.97]